MSRDRVLARDAPHRPACDRAGTRRVPADRACELQDPARRERARRSWRGSSRSCCTFPSVVDAELAEVRSAGAVCWPRSVPTCSCWPRRRAARATSRPTGSTTGVGDTRGVARGSRRDRLRSGPAWRRCTLTGHGRRAAARDRASCSSDSAVPLCLDTGHVLVGGGDPVALARGAGRSHRPRAPQGRRCRRRRAGARRVDLGYRRRGRPGLYRPLGEGDVDVARRDPHLGGRRLRGWYVLEQDAVLEREPEPGTGPFADASA